MGTAEKSSALRSLASALSLEVSKLEGLRITAWLALSIVVTVTAAAVTVAGSFHSGFLGLALGLVCTFWFAGVRTLQARGSWNPVMGWGSMAIENAAPWVFYAGIGVANPAEEAHHDWAPVFLYCGCLVVGMMKLSPRYALIMGALSIVQYLAVTVFVLMPRYKGSDPDEFTVVAEAVHCVLFGGAAIVVAWVTQGLRDAVGGVVSTLRASELFGKYRLEKELASGGMGVVWLATYCPEGGFQRPAAVKLVHTHLAEDAAFIDGFRREAELGARLVHSHIVQTFDFGVVENRTFLAMEFVDGPTLRDVMIKASAAHAEIPPAVAGAIARGILAGLGYAHAGARDADGHVLRVIHRDLAPSNILIAKGGSVKLTDFGIARALRERQQEETQTVAGHFDHMAPEQANAAPMDERTDLFCVGILLWEMLTGKPLFKRNNEPATLLAVSFGEIPAPSTVKAHLAPWDPLLARALDRDPARRFQTADEMADAVGLVDGEAGEEVIARFLQQLLAPPGTLAPTTRTSTTTPPRSPPPTTTPDPTMTKTEVDWHDAPTQLPPR